MKCPVCSGWIENGFHSIEPGMRGVIKKDQDTGEITHEPEMVRGQPTQGEQPK